MGECGCGEMNIVDAFLVENKVIAIDLYGGCRYCEENPLGITIHVFSKEQAKFWDINTKEKLNPEKYKSGEKSYPFIGKDDLIKACKKFEPEFEGYISLIDFMEDRGLDILREALEISWKKFKQNDPAGSTRSRAWRNI